MQEHFRKFGKYGLMMATLLLTVITADKSDGINLDQACEDKLNGKHSDGDNFIINISEESHARFNQRLREVAVDMVRLDYV